MPFPLAGNGVRWTPPNSDLRVDRRSKYSYTHKHKQDGDRCTSVHRSPSGSAGRAASICAGGE
eukprot:4726882-Prymnesium_polylepis.2